MRPVILILLFVQTAGELTLTGKITDVITHQPIPGANVEICCPQTAALTSDDGTYTLHFVPDQGYIGRMFISKKGYANELPPAKVRGGDFELTPAATISGHLIDRDTGRPLAGFLVQAQHGLMSRLANQPVGADGSFTITQLIPGDYIVKADPASGRKIIGGDAKPEEPGYGATWFPGVPRAEMAATITLSAGEKREVEVRLQKRERRHIAGFFEVPEGHENTSIRMSLAPPEHPLQTVVEGDIPKAGAFRIEGLDEGIYQLWAWTKGTGQPKLVATRKLEIADRNIDDLKLTMRNLVSIRAVLTMKEENTALPKDIAFFPVAETRGFETELSKRPGPLYADGLPPGEYWPELIVPPGYAVTAVSYNGRPVAHTSIDIEARESTVNFVVTSRTAAMTGFVRDADQNPIPDAAVVILPDPLPEALSGFSQGRDATISDSSGAFHLSSLAPGRYRVAALTGDDREHIRDITFLREHMRSADIVDLDFGQTATHDLHVK